MKKLTFILTIVMFALGCDLQHETIIDTSTDADPVVLRTGLQQRVGQDNEFAFDLFRKTIEISGDTNVFVSPLSVSIALGMTLNGAKGNTRTQMETALKMSSLTVSDINEYYQIMQSALPGLDPKTQLKLANSIWYKSGYSVKPDFLKINKDYFNSEVRELDFSQEWAKDTINNWCARKTNNLITNVIDRIPQNAVMYLINAIYFKGMWSKAFDSDGTTEATFTNERNEQVKVNMMHLKDTFNYTSDSYAQYVDLPYGNNAFSMTVVLPNSGKTVDDVLNYLTVENWNKVLKDMTMQEAEVYLPRFRMKCKYILNDELKQMGMQLPFEAGADFTNIADDDLLISRVIHDTYVEVNEKGTEAAAVTVIEIIKTSLPDYPVFRADKPFLFIIREKSTGVILFMGKMGNVIKF